MATELKILRAYIKAIGKYWWAIVTGLVLTLLDGAERLLGTWYRPPLWAKVTSGIVGLMLAQYFAYRDLARTATDTTAEFKELLRATFRNAELEWSLIAKPDAWLPEQTLLRQVDDFWDTLSEIYSQCPASWDSQALRNVIERLHATEKFRVGKRIPSKQDGDQICEQMKTALAEVQSILETA